jgi:hypothetical protein
MQLNDDERTFEEEEPACVYNPHSDLPHSQYEGYDDDFPIDLDAPTPVESLDVFGAGI